MEYVDGETLEHRLTRGPLPVDQSLRYARDIADALDNAHRQGIVHRDLKPSNVMITKSGAKLLDFGIATLKQARERLIDGVTRYDAVDGSGLCRRHVAVHGTGADRRQRGGFAD